MAGKVEKTAKSRHRMIDNLCLPASCKSAWNVLQSQQTGELISNY